MGTVIDLSVNGKPAPQGSKRHVGNGRMVEMSKAVGPWREAVRAEVQLEMWTQGRLGAPLEGPLAVTITFLLPRPRGHFGTGRNSACLKPSAPAYPTGTPDVDKLARSTLDGLVMGGAMRDDAQVVMLCAAKRYAEDAPPGCYIRLEVL
jgi:crossover junction endodeoxyribonuclease RusA